MTADQTRRKFWNGRWVEETGLRTTATLTLASSGGKGLLEKDAKGNLRRVIKESSCWVVVLDLIVNGHSVLQFIESSNLYQLPDLPVIIVGPDEDVGRFLLHKALRNTVQVTYLAVGRKNTFALTKRVALRGGEDKSVLQSGSSFRLFRTWKEGSDRSALIQGTQEPVKAYTKCLYCNQTNAGFLFKHKWPLNERLSKFIQSPDESKDLNGHVVNVVCNKRIPFVDYEDSDPTWDGPAGTVRPRDAFDIRLQQTAAKLFNYTFLIREPWDKEWGIPDEFGNWSGTAGTLQYEKADHSFMLTPLPTRMKVMDFTRVYVEDPFIIISLKPGPLPKSIYVWVGLVVSCLLFGVGYWFFEKIGGDFPGGKRQELTHTILFTLGLLLEDPPRRSAVRISCRTLVGCWLVACFVFMSAYRSALIAHLTVVKRYKPINTMEDLLARKRGYTWGRIPLSGASLLFLSENPSPVIREVYSTMLVLPAESQLNRVLAGGYSFVSRKYWALADLLKATMEGLPVHMSTTEYGISSGYGWAFRKGYPNLSTIDKLMQRLLEGGIVDFWIDVVVKKIARRMVEEGQSSGESKAVVIPDDDQVRVLTLEHLEGAFYLQGIGCCFGLIIFLLELIRYKWFPNVGFCKVSEMLAVFRSPALSFLQ
ncbi:glutamate receptor ionotropic, NMDA 2D-like [Macrobrachium nipponense]|uniref:glutamate receptor ionotropic, NMDA 2D-like n=1 Tax=Macrobrachium nipponense TaxID=159736 RepID=UPI0030C7FD2D